MLEFGASESVSVFCSDVAETAPKDPPFASSLRKYAIAKRTDI